jgi:hypothetical protein
VEFSPIPGGVLVDAKGVVQRNTMLDYGRVAQKRLAAARASYETGLTRDASAKTPLRYISINKLEKAVSDANGVVTEEMKYLAGLQGIRYIFYLEDSKDIVIAGPAEGWYPGFEGAMVGQTSQSPVCELQDLVVALRAFGPKTDGVDRIGCSIDPTPEGNARLQQFQKDFGSQTSRNQFGRFVDGVKSALGNHTVRIDGISGKTHAAQVLVAADYRMKRIGLGFDPVPVRMETFVSRTTPNVGNALFRWYFVPDYQSVVATADGFALELTSDRVKLVAEGELDESKARADAASIAYTRSFTRNYPDIAKRILVFAQLRNFIDMTVAAAFIQQQDFYGKSGWQMTLFGDEKKFAVETQTVPAEVAPVVGYKVRGGTLMAPVGGGIVIEPDEIIAKENVKMDNGAVAEIKKKVQIDLPAGAWWWQ